jgi:hypothetical protein
MERMERGVDTHYRQNIVSPDAYGRGSRVMQDQRAALKRKRVRLLCAPCGARIDHITDNGLKLTYRIREGWSDLDEHGQLILVASKTWRCPRCGRTYPVTLERMRVEYQQALEHGGVITLPLSKL